MTTCFFLLLILLSFAFHFIFYLIVSLLSQRSKIQGNSQNQSQKKQANTQKEVGILGHHTNHKNTAQIPYSSSLVDPLHHSNIKEIGNRLVNSYQLLFLCGCSRASQKRNFVLYQRAKLTNFPILFLFGPNTQGAQESSWSIQHIDTKKLCFWDALGCRLAF